MGFSVWQGVSHKCASTTTGKPIESLTKGLRTKVPVKKSGIRTKVPVESVSKCPLAGSIDKGSLLNIWNAILEINYWPIFSIARDIVEELPIMAVPPVMNRIAESISDLAQLGVTTYHDLTGRMFQTLITDRKFLATFYTLPESACLLAELAVERLDVDWSDKAVVESLRIADFACGTGGLALRGAACGLSAIPQG